MDRNDINGFLAGLLVHIVVALLLVVVPIRPSAGPTVVQVDVRKKERPVEPPPPPPKRVEPPKPPEPKKIKVKEPKPPEPAKAPPPNETPKEPPREMPKEPPKPVFGVSESSTVSDSSFSVPTGNTTVADPKAPRPQGPVAPLPPAPPASAPAPVFKPASALEIRDYPLADESSCQPPRRLYPTDLIDQGVEGEVQMRVEISDTGKVVGVKLLRGPHKQLNDLSVMWMRTRCRFEPARNTANKPVPYAITYTVTWQIDR